MEALYFRDRFPKKDIHNIPEGFKEVDRGVYVSDTEVVITGNPPDETLYPDGHNCDEMGCGWEHVIARGKLM